MKTRSIRHTLVTQSRAFRAVLGLMSVLGMGASAHAFEKTCDGGLISGRLTTTGGNL